MMAASFAYHRPRTVDEVLACLAQLGPQARIIAGGHSLVPLLKLRLATPAHLVDIARIPELQGIEEDGRWVFLGAMATYHDALTSALVAQELPLLAKAAAMVGDLAVRNRGTVAGALCHADPAGDIPAVAVALGAELLVAGPHGRRMVSVEDFLLGPMTTALAADEMVTGVRFPKMGRDMGEYAKCAHPASGYAVVGVAVALARDVANGTVRNLRIGITGVGPMAYRPRKVEAALDGQVLTGSMIAEAVEFCTEGIEPLADLFASAEYRRHLCQVYTERALRAAWG